MHLEVVIAIDTDLQCGTGCLQLAVCASLCKLHIKHDIIEVEVGIVFNTVKSVVRQVVCVQILSNDAVPYWLRCGCGRLRCGRLRCRLWIFLLWLYKFGIEAILTSLNDSKQQVTVRLVIIAHTKHIALFHITLGYVTDSSTAIGVLIGILELVGVISMGFAFCIHVPDIDTEIIVAIHVDCPGSRL